MTSTETYLSETKAAFSHKLSAIFLPLLLCYSAGAVLSYLVARCLCSQFYYVSCPVSFISVYGTLSTLVSYMKRTIWQTAAIFFSAFTFFPTWISTLTAIYRGICTGICLFLVSSGMVQGLDSYPQITLSLYFLTSVLLFLFASYVHVYSKALPVMWKHRDYKNLQVLLFEYIKCFMVMSGGILAVYMFAIILS